MTSDERLALIWRKINRANQHIGELQQTWSDFVGKDPYKVGIKQDPETQHLVYYIAHAEAPPAVMASIAGDILHNLRCALDHLAQQLYLVGTPGAVGFRDDTGFPIGGSAKGFKKLAGRKIEGMRQDAQTAIRAMEPYKGGKSDALWTLHRLNNIDKHRLLVTVDSHFQGIDIGADITRRLSEMMGKPVPAMEIVIREAGAEIRPVKVGDELLRTPDTKPNEDFKFKGFVALYEPGVLEGEPLIKTVKDFSQLVGDTVSAFRSCLE